MFIISICICVFSFSSFQIFKKNIIVIAHRGDHTQAPENTLLAFQNAIELGVDYIEIDLRMTKDSILVIMHDKDLQRMTEKASLVEDLSFLDIKDLKIRDLQHPEWGKHSIPTFEEVLNLVKNSNAGIYLDFKKASVKLAYQLILKTKMENKLVVYINSEQQYKDWRNIAPKIPLMLSLPDFVKDSNTLENFLKTNSAEILDGSFSNYTQEMVNKAHQYQRQVWADIQGENEHLNWNKAINTGLDGLQTDHPEDLIKYLKEKNLK